MRLFLAIIISTVIAILLFGCYTSKTAKKQVDKALLKYPEVAAAEIRKADPCVTLSSDTITVTKDELVYVDCPQDYYTAHDTTIVTDTLTKIDKSNSVKYIKVPVHLPVQIKYITQKVRDSADGVIIANLTDRLSKMTIQDARHKGSSDKWFWIAMGLIAVLVAIIGVWGYLKFKSFSFKKILQ